MTGFITELRYKIKQLLTLDTIGVAKSQGTEENVLLTNTIQMFGKVRLLRPSIGEPRHDLKSKLV